MPYAQLSTVRVHYYESGHGPQTLLLVHGFQSSGRIWQLVSERLPAELYRVIAVDNRGAGRSDAPEGEGAFGVEPFAADLQELIEALDLRDVIVVGHSMGGATAMQLAVTHPERLRGLVLVDPAGPNGIRRGSDDVEAEVTARVNRRGLPDVQTLIAGYGPDAPPEWARALAEDVAAAPERRLRGSYRSMLNLRIGEAVSRLTLPILLIAGDNDQTVPLPDLLDTYRLLPRGSGLHVWHGVGHSPNVETPDRFVRVLRRFVERTVPEHQAARTPVVT
jgi:branched-chain amino acid transport system permease protein